MGNALTIASAGFADASFAADVLDPTAVTALAYGLRVERATQAMVSEALFTVAGRCLLLQILGEVTTVLETAANAIKLQLNPTATGSSVDMCATLDVNAKAVATLLGITGTFADALVGGLSIPAQATPVILQPGTIDLAVADETTTGSVKWTAWYVPMEADASIVAA